MLLPLKPNEGNRARPDYGIDAPYVIRNLAAAGGVCLVLALASASLRWLFSPAFSLLASAAFWLYCSKAGKMRFREAILNRIDWSGNERVLDVGCGSGLLLIGAAKQLTDGRAVGVDLWRGADLSNNRVETTLSNASIEGVSERVSVVEGDARRLPFDDLSFDVVVSLHALHNIGKREERVQALAEVVRVLAPGGRLVLADFRNTGDYARVLRSMGMTDARKQLVCWVLFCPCFAAVGRKPGQKGMGL